MSASPVAGDELYTRAARSASAQVIEAYSTSFGRAARLLHEPVRTHVRCIYALVRIADEIVDCPDLGIGAGSGVLPPDERARRLDALEAETVAALGSGFSTNLVVHAFAATARECDIGLDLVRPFFASMRTDLVTSSHDDASLSTYVYGSAEVVGLMCLRVFVATSADAPPERARLYERWAPGARRLGAAFQKLNFLRDLAADESDLGRTYFPGVDAAHLTDEQRDALLDDADLDLAAAAAVIPQLPRSCRRAVQTAHDLFAALSRRLRSTPAAAIAEHRVSVPPTAKLRVVAHSALSAYRPRLGSASARAGR
ncbi:phytoene/squalene synthase family protein [Cellulomonas alba]|uniref:Squalene/phytoene synthase family protein n=1 Tax=Cellulomonas alba TaxID=3053467 RepID=A0ABT7SBD4_9CELL|nr:squalene/phytoene synthase family protein [Cellulomonas alba]MDM7853496.1 squalene/phytoene synthase family protein [Cellulomonas alba]